MPPYLAPPYFRLSRLPVTTKIALTCFLLAILGALAFSAYPLFAERTRFRLQEVRDNFAPVDWNDPEAISYYSQAGRLPPSEKSLRQRIDIVHPHSFLMPILFFILCHLMEMTPAPRAFKIVLYLAGFAAMIFVTCAPLTMHRWPALAPAMIPALLTLWGSFALMALWPGAFLWLDRRPV